MTIQILQADARKIPLADASVDCVVTSPPYWGLRDYGIKDAIGLEQSWDEYLSEMMQVFAEAWRVLKPTGTCFVNMGDSYWNSGAGGNPEDSPHKKQKTNSGSCGVLAHARRAGVYGTSGKELEGSPKRDCLCGNLCGVCRVVYQNHTTRNDGLPESMLRASLSLSNHGRRVSAPCHLPTSDSTPLAGHISNATPDRSRVPVLARAALRAVLASTMLQSSPQLLDECLRRASIGECLLCARSLADCAQASLDKLDCICGTGEIPSPSIRHTSGNCLSALAYPHSTTAYLKPKDLIGQPWRLAFALQAAGWYLRSDIIWHKPAPMPESCRDRPTKAHEYIFLLSKSEKYFFDQAAWMEPCSVNTHDRHGATSAYAVDHVPRGRKTKAWPPVAGSAHGPGDHSAIAHNTPGAHPKTVGRVKNNESMDAALAIMPAKRNRRTVWTVAAQPTSEHHFATFPEALVEPCLLAGCPVGGTVLDPFGGSGTTAVVANRQGKNAVLLELNPAYIEIARRRCFADVVPTVKEKAAGQRLIYT